MKLYQRLIVPVITGLFALSGCTLNPYQETEKCEERIEELEDRVASDKIRIAELENMVTSEKKDVAPKEKKRENSYWENKVGYRFVINERLGFSELYNTVMGFSVKKGTKGVEEELVQKDYDSYGSLIMTRIIVDQDHDEIPDKYKFIIYRYSYEYHTHYKNHLIPEHLREPIFIGSGEATRNADGTLKLNGMDDDSEENIIWFNDITTVYQEFKEKYNLNERIENHKGSKKIEVGPEEDLLFNLPATKD